MPTPLQQLVIDLFAHLDEQEGWQADRIVGDLHPSAVMSLLHDAFAQAGVPQGLYAVEVCNHPIRKGSVAHHNQIDTIYRMALYLVVDGQPMGFSGFDRIQARLEVLPSIQACEQQMRASIAKDHPRVNAWHVASNEQTCSGYLLPGYAAPIRAALAPMLAELQAGQIQQSTHPAATATQRPRF